MAEVEALWYVYDLDNVCVFLPVFRHDLHKRYVKEWPCLVLFCDFFYVTQKNTKGPESQARARKHNDPLAVTCQLLILGKRGRLLLPLMVLRRWR